MDIVEEKIAPKRAERTADTDCAEQIAAEYIAPAMCGFVDYILKTAAENGVKTLYFLARDGYLMQKIAEKLAAKREYGLKLRYLYCSRASLRLSAIGIMPRSEVYGLFLMSGVSVTPKALLDRLFLTAEQRSEIYRDIGFTADEKALYPAARFMADLAVHYLENYGK